MNRPKNARAAHTWWAPVDARRALVVISSITLLSVACEPPPPEPATQLTPVAPSAAPVGRAEPTVPPTPIAEPKSGNEAKLQKYIVVDQFGYRPDMKKVAVLVDPQEGWNKDDAFEPGPTYEVRKWDDAAVVYSGKITPWKGGAIEPNAGDRGFWFDFSEVKTPGSYFVYDKTRGVRSHRFDINVNVYRDMLKAAARMYYFNRANFAKVAPYACVGQKCWLWGADILGPGQDKEARSVRDRDNPKTARDLSGGWWDAGDTDKYVTFTMDPVNQLLTAYQENPGPFTDDYNIPESKNGIPDLLDEVKVELDWLKKMQPADLKGGVLIKMGSVDYDDPLRDPKKPKRFYYPEPCSSSTITASADFAHAALVLRAIPKLKNYADDLGKRAVNAWNWFQTHPQSDACDDGTIKSGDADRAVKEQPPAGVVAAVYLFALTSEQKYNDYIKKNYTLTRPFQEDRWSVYDQAQGDALLFYADLKNADPAVRDAIVKQKKSQAASVELYKFKPDLDLYRAYMREDSYHWGSNNQRAAFGNTNFDMVQHHLCTPAEEATYRERAAGMLNSFHGVNPMQMVYLSNMSAYGAEESANEIYHTWFRDKDPEWDNAKTSKFGPAPGYVPGGPNKSYCKGQDPKQNKCVNSRLSKQPAQKAYLDFNTAWDPPQEHDKSWEITEPGIYYQASYVRLVSKFVD